MLTDEWHARSFLVELKPRADYASVFIDCPFPDGNCHVKEDEGASSSTASAELLRIKDHSIELIRNVASNSEPQDIKEEGDFVAYVSRMRFVPDTVCSLSWGDRQRLLMCKVRVEADDLLIIPKSFQRIATDISNANPLDEFVKGASSHPIFLTCVNCGHSLLASLPGKLELQPLPDDDFLETSPGMEYFCRDSCCHQCEHPAHQLDLVGGLPDQQWIPSESRAILANSFIMVHMKPLKPNAITADHSTGLVQCVKCLASIGKLSRRNPKIVQFDNAVTNLTVWDGQDLYVKERFGCLERYFVFLLLSQCETQSTLKLVVRTYDKRPYLLIWLLESYVLIMHGLLQESRSQNDLDDNSEELVAPFPALKMLYKVFDADSAKNDPRANGQDTSVGIIELPLQCCTQLMEMLLSSSHILPPICRFMGQFYVGFLKLEASS